MKLFGKRVTSSLTRERVLKLTSTFFLGSIAVASAHGQKPDRADQELTGAFFVAVRDILKSAGVAPSDLSLLPPAELLQVNMLHAALFEDDATVEAAAALLGPKNLSKNMAAAQDVRAFAASVRSAEKAKAAQAAEKLKEEGASRIDLVAALGGRAGEFHARLLEWLKAQAPDPDLWHDLVLDGDPDGKDDIFLWIVRQPECDAATAAMIFHANNSFEFLEPPPTSARPGEAVRTEIAATVSRRWSAKDFPSFRFSFLEMGHEESLDTYRRQAKAALDRHGRTAFDIDETLFEFRDGEPTKSKYYYSDFVTFAERYGVSSR